MRFRGHEVLFYLFLLGLMVPLEATIVPLYYDLRDVGLTDTYWALILPQAAHLGRVRHVLDARLLPRRCRARWWRRRGSTAPRAGRRCGGSMLPLGRPAVLTMVVLVFMWTWNEFLLALVMVSDEALRTAPLGLAFFQGRNTTDEALLAAGAVIVAAPVVLVYLFLQRHFIRGMLTGAVKALMASVAFRRGEQAVRRGRGGARPHARGRRRRADGARRPVGLGQDDRAADAGRARGGRRRAGRDRRSAWSTTCRRASATWRWCSRTTRCTRR